MRRLTLISVLLLGVAYSAAPAAQSAQTQAAPAAQSAQTQTTPATPEVQSAQAQAAPAAPAKSIFHVRYIADGTVYLDAGRNAGLEEGMHLHLVHADANGGTTDAVRFQGQEPIAEVRIVSVADSSCAAEIIKSREDLVAGDIAYLDVGSIQLREEKSNAVESENYPVVVTFSYGDPLDEEVRATTVSPQTAPIENQMRGRFGWDMGTISEPGGFSSRQVGLMVQADMTRLGGTHWNFTGYWRGNLNSQSTGTAGAVAPVTLNDLMNRTYHLGLYYQNPDSAITMGIGRLYLPWASSLSTIDGAYIGRRLTQTITVGAFGGSTPDPTSWSYSPNQNIAGTFINYARGDYDHERINSTFGLAMTSIQWHVAREFAFFENTFSLGRTFSVYNSIQADDGRTALAGIAYKTGLTQSFTSVRYQASKLLTFNLNHNYLRNLPTFNPLLISTGLLDQYLFQGLSGGVRLEFPYHVALSTDIGRSKSSTDTKTSWNQMYGINFGQIGKTGFQVDVRYTKFNSSFGQGTYEYVSVSRSLADRFHIQLQGGTQHLNSLLSSNSSSRFVTGIVDWSIGPRYFLEAQYTLNMGTTMNYRQMNLTFGYRFGGLGRK